MTYREVGAWSAGAVCRCSGTVSKRVVTLTTISLLSRGQPLFAAIDMMKFERGSLDAKSAHW